MLGFNFKGINNINYYALFVVLATMFYGINLNFIKFRLRGLHPLDITSISLVMVLVPASIYLLGFSSFTSKVTHAIHLSSLLYVLLLGVLGTGIALILFNKLVKISSPVFTSSVTYLIPVVALAWGFLDGETMFVHHFTGFLLILIGVLLINRKAPNKI